MFDTDKPIRIIGDIHGYWPEYYSIIEEPINSIQIGDLGLGFVNPVTGFSSDSELDSMLSSTKSNGKFHRFIRGNHDSPAACRINPRWIPDSTVWKDMMFIGGADSIDKAWRIENVDWWEDEELSISDFQESISIFEEAKPRIMFTHDCPLSIAKRLWKYDINSSGSRTNQALQAMFEIHQPDKWFFGHHHETSDIQLGKTHFKCLGINDFYDLKI